MRRFRVFLLSVVLSALAYSDGNKSGLVHIDQSCEIKKASKDKDELLVADLDMDMIKEVRDLWQFYRDRRPETYTQLTNL